MVKAFHIVLGSKLPDELFSVGQDSFMCLDKPSGACTQYHNNETNLGFSRQLTVLADFRAVLRSHTLELVFEVLYNSLLRRLLLLLLPDMAVELVHASLKLVIRT